MTTVGSLCSGFGGLDDAVCAHHGARLAWQAENDQDATKVLAVRYPDVPNLGDVTTVEWARVEPVDIVCAGFPCTPASTAGRRRGMADERWLWDDVERAVRGLGPRRVVLENVPGLLTVDGGRALAAVMHGLAAMGFDAEWGVVTAAAAGACHRRARLFVVADARGTGRGRQRPWPAEPRPGGGENGGRTPEPRRRGRSPADPIGGRPQLRRRPGVLADPPGTVEGEGGQRERGRHPTRYCGEAARQDRWAQYWPAVRRWEQLIGRPPPEPLVGRQLNARFCEWMMDRPDGWVTDVLSNRKALKVLGNGVVAAQGRLAQELIDGADAPIFGDAAVLLPTPVANDTGRTPAAHLAMRAGMGGGARTSVTSLTVAARLLADG